MLSRSACRANRARCWASGVLASPLAIVPPSIRAWALQPTCLGYVPYAASIKRLTSISPTQLASLFGRNRDVTDPWRGALLMRTLIRGRVIKLDQDTIDTDLISPSIWQRQALGDPELKALRPHALESVRPGLDDY